MIVFGLLSSLSGILTFITLLLGIPRQRHPVRSGWFIESAITELTVTLVLRTSRPCATQGRAAPELAVMGPSPLNEPTPRGSAESAIWVLLIRRRMLCSSRWVIRGLAEG